MIWQGCALALSEKPPPAKLVTDEDTACSARRPRHLRLRANQSHVLPLARCAPGALGKEDKDIPTLTPFLPAPEGASGAAIVICPGGGYGGLAPHEGEQYARWLNEQGIAGFVLKYRLGPGGYHHPAMLQDAARAVRTVRARAAEWKLDTKHIGIMGSSAGGHLASTLLTHSTPASLRLRIPSSAKARGPISASFAIPGSA